MKPLANEETQQRRFAFALLAMQHNRVKPAEIEIVKNDDDRNCCSTHEGQILATYLFASVSARLMMLLTGPTRMILISAVVVESKETTTATTILSPGPGRLFGKKPYGPLGTE